MKKLISYWKECDRSDWFSFDYEPNKLLLEKGEHDHIHFNLKWIRNRLSWVYKPNKICVFFCLKKNIYFLSGKYTSIFSLSKNKNIFQLKNMYIYFLSGKYKYIFYIKKDILFCQEDEYTYVYCLAVTICRTLPWHWQRHGNALPGWKTSDVQRPRVGSVSAPWRPN